MLLVVFGEGEQATMWITFPRPHYSIAACLARLSMCAVNERGCDGAFLLVLGPTFVRRTLRHPPLAARPRYRRHGMPRPRLARLKGESEAIVNVDYCLEWNCHHHHRTRELPATPL